MSSITATTRHKLTITQVRHLPRESFIQTFKDLYEHHPIIAELVYDRFHQTKLSNADDKSNNHKNNNNNDSGESTTPTVVIHKTSELLDLFNQMLTEWLSQNSPHNALQLIRSHPKLGVAKLSSSPMVSSSPSSLTENSLREQTMTGLISSDVSREEIEEFHRLNDAYSEKFGFPFIVCVRAQKRKDAILEAFRRRIQSESVSQEQETALEQIRMIAAIRLSDIVVDDDDDDRDTVDGDAQQPTSRL